VGLSAGSHERHGPAVAQHGTAGWVLGGAVTETWQDEAEVYVYSTTTRAGRAVIKSAQFADWAREAARSTVPPARRGKVAATASIPNLVRTQC